MHAVGHLGVTIYEMLLESGGKFDFNDHMFAHIATSEFKTFTTFFTPQPQ